RPPPTPTLFPYTTLFRSDGPAGLAVAVGALAVQPDAALVGVLEPAEQVQQRRLARAGRAGDRDELAAVHGQVHTAHGVRGGALRSEEHTSELQSRENLVC